jgi:hypothetical protein
MNLLANTTNDPNLLPNQLMNQINNFLSIISQNNTELYMALNQAIMQLMDQLKYPLSTDEINNLLNSITSLNFNQIIKENMREMSIDFAEFLGSVARLLNETDLTESEKNHLNIYIPDIIARLSQVNSLEEAWPIIEPVIRFHLALLLGDRSIITSPEPYRRALDVVLEAIANEPTLKRVLAQEEFKKVVTKFTTNLMATLDFDFSVRSVLPELEMFSSAQLLMALKEFAESYLNEFYVSRNVQNFVNMEQFFNALLDYLFGMTKTDIMDILRELGLFKYSMSVQSSSTGAAPRMIDTKFLKVVEDMRKNNLGEIANYLNTNTERPRRKVDNIIIA